MTKLGTARLSLPWSIAGATARAMPDGRVARRRRGILVGAVSESDHEFRPTEIFSFFGEAKFAEFRLTVDAQVVCVAREFVWDGEAKLSEFRLGGVTKFVPGGAKFVKHFKVPRQLSKT